MRRGGFSLETQKRKIRTLQTTEGNEEAEENTTVVIATSLRGGRTTAGLTQPNRSGRGKGITNNRRSGEAAITYEPIYQHYEAKIYTPNN